MLRTLTVSCLAVLLSLGQSSCAQDKQDQVSKPAWKTGDSWRVKCPEMSYHPSIGSCKIGEYTMNIKVLGIEKTARGVECYVLEIRPGDDLPDNIKKYSDIIVERVYYATETLELMTVERWQIEKDGHESKLGREVSTDRHPLSAIYYGRSGSWIPLLLPQFPLVRGRTVYCKNEYKQNVVKQRAEAGENVALSFSGDVVVEAAQGKDASITGATTVTFYSTVTYSKSGDFRTKECEQVWAPGKPWWTTARLYFGQKVTEFTLAE